MDRQDVRMSEARDRQGLLLEAMETIRAGREGRRQNLYGNVPAKPWVMSAVDRPHSSRPNQRDDGERADTGIRRDSHRQHY